MAGARMIDQQIHSIPVNVSRFTELDFVLRPKDVEKHLAVSFK